MIRETINALLACVVTFVVCAVVYPAAVYGLGHTLFPWRAEGSLIERDGQVIGSALIAQPFSPGKYFSPRPSAAGADGYSADAAGGSNLGTTNPALRDRIALDTARRISARSGDPGLKRDLDRVDAARSGLKSLKDGKMPTGAIRDTIAGLERDAATALAGALDRSAELGEATGGRVPVDLVTASGSGLDPEISIEAARYQAARVAAVREVPLDRVVKLIDARVDRSGAAIGAPARVNVFLLNLDLDRELVPSPPAQTH